MTRKKKTIKRMKGRPRGGASVPCPVCGGNTSVTLTRRDGVKVFRWRKCASDHGFRSVEKVLA